MYLHLVGAATVLLIRKHPVADLGYNAHALPQFHHRSKVIQHCYNFNQQIMLKQ